MRTMLVTLLAVLLALLANPASAGERVAVVEGPPPLVITAGDSITEGAGAAKHWSYPDQLRRMYRGQFRVENVGHSASCLVATGCGHGETLLSSFGREVLSQHPDIVVLSIGRNDLCHATTPQFKRAMRSLRLAGMRSGALVVFGTITPPNDRWQWPCEDQAHEINDWLRTFPHTIDFAASVANHDGALRKTYDHGDGLHPNGYGYRVMARTAGETLTALLD